MFARLRRRAGPTAGPSPWLRTARLSTDRPVLVGAGAAVLLLTLALPFAGARGAGGRSMSPGSDRAG
ncbi:hypothetical protein ACIQVT_25885 [Streptomyces sp. NPDC100445]|uniref:hypothetical protein n=1 Tax=Streptomyces sp. NPDC100445 TaxID=3366102 RepID=UPI00380B7A1A